MLHTILWDWNGTLLDDVEVALAAMNEMLARRGLPLLQGREPYRDIFTFPVRAYYTAAGLDLSAEPFESLAVEWTGLYHRFYPRCGLFPAARGVLQAVGEMGLEQAIVSASHQQALDSQVEEQGLGGFFQARLGISDIYAGKQSGPGPALSEKPGRPAGAGPICRGHPPRLGGGPGGRLPTAVLLAQGHQSRARLETAGVPVLESLTQVPAFLRDVKLNPPPETERTRRPKSRASRNSQRAAACCGGSFYACLKCFDKYQTKFWHRRTFLLC